MSGITYNLQIDSKFRDVEKYPNPCDFGVTFINTNTGTSVLGQPLSEDLLYSPISIDPDYLESNIKIENAEIFTYLRNENKILISGVMTLSSGSIFSIRYEPQPLLDLPNTVIMYTGYTIVSLTGINIYLNPFIAVISNDEEKYSIDWITYLTQYTGVISQIQNNSSRSTIRISPTQKDVVFWGFDFSSSINLTQYINNKAQLLKSIPEPSKGNTSIIVFGFNIEDGTPYKYEAREWGYQLFTSNYSLEQTKDNGRFNINVDNSNNLYVSGNISTFNPSYEYTKLNLTGPGLSKGWFNDNIIYYTTGSSGDVSYTHIFPINIENTVPQFVTGSPSSILFVDSNNTGPPIYKSTYVIDKDPSGAYTLLGYIRYDFLRNGTGVYLIGSMNDNPRTWTSYESRIYRLDPHAGTGTLCCTFGSGPSPIYYPSGLFSINMGTDIYSFQRCGGTGSYGNNRPDKLLIHKFDTLTSIGTTLTFTGPILGLPTGQNGYPSMLGGSPPGIQECICGQVVGTDIYIYLGNQNLLTGITITMPIFVLKWDTLTNTLTNYGVREFGSGWSYFEGIINYSSGRKLLVSAILVVSSITLFYDVTDPINIFLVNSIPQNLYQFRPVYFNSKIYAYAFEEGEMSIWDITDPTNFFVISKSFPIANGNYEWSFINTYKYEEIGLGGNDIDGWYYYKTQPLLSDYVSIKVDYVTKNIEQYIHYDEEYIYQTFYTPKYYNNTSVQNFSNKMFLLSVYNKSFIFDDITNINYKPNRNYVNLVPFGFTQILNRISGLLITKYNTFVFDHSSGIYILFGFYNKLGLYFYDDNLNQITELYQEPVSSLLNGIVYINSYIVNNERFAIFVFVNNIVKIYRIDNLTTLTLVSTTSPSAGSFTNSFAAILVYHVKIDKYFLHIFGGTNIILNQNPRRINNIDITNPYSPIPTPSVFAYLMDLGTNMSSNGLAYTEDSNLNTYLYIPQGVTILTFDITNPYNYDRKVRVYKFLVTLGNGIGSLQIFTNQINKKKYLLTQYYGNRNFKPNPIYLFDITDEVNPKFINYNIVFKDNINENPVHNITICQNGNKTYASFMLLNYYYSTGAWAPNPIPNPGSTGATGADIYNNYLYFLYDLSNPEFASITQNQTNISSTYNEIPFNGSSFITKINANGTIGWLSYIGASPNSEGQFINISNFTFDNSRRYIYLSGGWQNTIAFYQNSPTGFYNYFNSKNTVYNSFVSKLNIFTGEWIWALPLIGNLDDFTQRLSYQNYKESELLLMVIHFNSLSLNVYQAINSSLYPSSILNNIINIVNNTSSVSSVLYAFNTSGYVVWSILFFSKIPLTSVYIKDVDSTDGIITIIGFTNTQELYCIDASGLETQITYSQIDTLKQQYIFIYRFNYQGIYIASQRIDFPKSNFYLNLNDIKVYTADNNFIFPISFKNQYQDKIDIFNKDGTYASSISQYTPIIKNTILVSYKNNSQFIDINNKSYSKIKILYPKNITIPSLINFYNYIIGYIDDPTLNNSFNIRNNEIENNYLYLTLNQYIDTTKIKRIFYNYGNTGQFIRPDLNFFRTTISKTIQNGYVIVDYIDSLNSIIYLTNKNFTQNNNLFITLSSGTNIPVQYISNYSGSQDVLIYSSGSTISNNNLPFLSINSKNLSAYYTYQFYPGSLDKSNYFIIRKLTMTIPNRLIRNSSYSGLRDLNDLPYLYLKIFNENITKNIDINNFNLVYDNNINTGTNASFQFPISYAGSTSNFTTLSLDIQPRIKFSYNYYNFRFQLLDPEGEVIVFDPTPYKTSDSIFTGQVPANLLNITVRMQIQLSN